MLLPIRGGAHGTEWRTVRASRCISRVVQIRPYKSDTKLGVEVEFFTSWNGEEDTTDFVATALTIDIEPAMLAACIKVLPVDIGWVAMDNHDDFVKLPVEQWKLLVRDVKDTSDPAIHI